MSLTKMTHPAILAEYVSKQKNYNDLLGLIKGLVSPIFASRLYHLDIDREQELDDFSHSFIEKAIRQYKRFNSLPDTYRAKTQNQVADFLAFVHQCAVNKIQVRRGEFRSYCKLQAHTWCDQIHKKTIHSSLFLAQDAQCTKELKIEEHSQETEQLLKYLGSKQAVYRQYLVLELSGYAPSEIQDSLCLSKKERAYTKDMVRYHARQFAKKLRLGIPLQKTLCPSMEYKSEPISQTPIKLVSPNAEKHTIAPKDATRFVKRHGFRPCELRWLVSGRVQEVRGWRLDVCPTQT